MNPRIKAAVVPVPAERDIVLTMPESVALTLAVVLSLVGGSPEGYRGQMDDLLRALSSCGIRWEDSPLRPRGSLLLPRIGNR